MTSAPNEFDERFDPPLDTEAGKLNNVQQDEKLSGLLLLRLVFQSLGVVYGDLGASPLYVFYNTFPDGIQESEDVIGALSIIIYWLTLITLRPLDHSGDRTNAVQIAFTAIVFPCLILAYTGQAAYLMKNSDYVADVFYRSIPDSVYWPALIITIGAAIVASQATITSMFSLIKQAVALCCFPRVKVVHTSKKFLNQIYIPDINWIVMILCIAVAARSVPEGERFLIRRIGPKNFCMFSCVARYGYRDDHLKDEDFEGKVMDSLYAFIRLESMMDGCSDSDDEGMSGDYDSNDKCHEAEISSPVDEVDELEFLNKCRDSGVVHMLGNTVVVAKRDSRFYKKIAIDYLYAFLRKICRHNTS